MSEKKKTALAASKKPKKAKKGAPDRVAEQLRAKKKKAAAAPKVERGISARQEKFAQLYASGKTATDAYREAYGPSKGAEASASRLLSVAKVADRVKALQALAAEGAVLSLAEKRKFLRRVVMTPLGEVDETSELCQSAEYQVTGGVRGQLRRGQADRGNEEEEPEMTTVKIKMPDKLKAIELDAKLAGELKGEPIKLEVGDALLDLLADIRGKR